MYVAYNPNMASCKSLTAGTSRERQLGMPYLAIKIYIIDVTLKLDFTLAKIQSQIFIKADSTR